MLAILRARNSCVVQFGCYSTERHRPELAD